MRNEIVTINSRAYDLRIRRSWQCKQVEKKDSMLLFVGKFDVDVDHPQLGIIRRGTISYEYYWLDRWYNVFRFLETEGRVRNYYCNINMPPEFNNGVLDYVDLDIDVVIWPDFTYSVLDVGEYEASAARYNYPESVKTNVQRALVELIGLIEARAFPFDMKSARNKHAKKA